MLSEKVWTRTKKSCEVYAVQKNRLKFEGHICPTLVPLLGTTGCDRVTEISRRTANLATSTARLITETRRRLDLAGGSVSECGW